MPKIILEHKMDCQDEFTVLQSWTFAHVKPEMMDMCAPVGAYLLKRYAGFQPGDTLRLRLVDQCPKCQKLVDHEKLEHYDPARRPNPDMICLDCQRRVTKSARTGKVHLQDPTTSENRGLCGEMGEHTMSWHEIKRGRITCATCLQIHTRTERIQDVHSMQHRDVAAYMHEVGRHFE